MALLFDIAVLIVIFFAVSLVAAGPDPERLQGHQSTRSARSNDLHDAQSERRSTRRSRVERRQVGERQRSRPRSDLKSAQKDFDSGEEGRQARPASRAHRTATTKQRQKQADDADRQPTSSHDREYLTVGVVTLVLALLYLVPITAIEGPDASGMRNREHQGGARSTDRRCGWYAVVHCGSRIPVLLARSRIPVVRPRSSASAWWRWGYFDRNGQGIHDKLARTVVVAA